MWEGKQTAKTSYSINYILYKLYYVRNKTHSPCPHTKNQGENLGEFEGRSVAFWVKTKMQARVFTCSRILTNFVEHFFVLHSTIKAPLFQSKCTNYPNYFINSFEMKQPRIQISRRHGKNGLLVVNGFGKYSGNPELNAFKN